MYWMTDPSSGRTNVDAESANRGEADERIERIYLDFDKVEKTVEVFWKGLALPEIQIFIR
jgi:hypothetical protein